MTITELSGVADESAWEAYVDRHPHRTLYHRLEWKRVVERAFGYRPQYLIVHGNGGAVVGILPLFLISTRLRRVLASIPLRDRGGPLADSGPVAVALLEAATRLAAEARVAYLELKLTEQLDAAVCGRLRLQEGAEWIDSYLPVSKSAAGMWAAFDPEARRAVRKAERALTVVRGERESDLAAFYGLFEITRHRLGVPVYSVDFFRVLFEELVPHDHARLYFAVAPGGRRVAGVLLLRDEGQAYYAYTASLPSALEHRPNDLLVWHLIRELAAEGGGVLHFHADSPYQRGLIAFKAKWGTRQRPVRRYFFLHGTRRIPTRDGDHPRYAWARAAWRRLPLAVARVVGPPFIRAIG